MKILEAEKLSKEDWSNLLQGILFTHKITERELSKILQVSVSSISSWLNKKREISEDFQLKILSFVKNNKIPLKELLKLGKKVKNSLVLDDKILNKMKCIKRAELMEEDVLIFKNGKWFLNTPLLFPRDFNGKDIKFIFLNRFIVVFFENRNKENPQPLKLPALIEINKDFLVGLGIWVAEGTKSERRPKVSNSEPLIIQQSIKFFEHIGINKEKLTGWVQVHSRSRFKNNKIKVKNFWLKVTGLKKEQIKSVVIKKDRSKIKRIPVKEMGTFHLECNFLLSRLLIDGLLSNVENIINNVPNSELSFLKGVIAGEGWCGRTRKGVVNEVTITLKEKRWRRLTLSLLKKIGIGGEESEKSSDITICGFKNFKKMIEVNIFEFLPEMKKRLEEGFILLSSHKVPFKNKERIIGLLKNAGKPLTVKEISMQLGIGKRGVTKHLHELLKLSKSKVSCIKGKPPNPNKWFIKD